MVSFSSSLSTASAFPYPRSVGQFRAAYAVATLFPRRGFYFEPSFSPYFSCEVLQPSAARGRTYSRTFENLLPRPFLPGRPPFPALWPRFVFLFPLASYRICTVGRFLSAIFTSSQVGPMDQALSRAFSPPRPSAANQDNPSPARLAL